MICCFDDFTFLSYNDDETINIKCKYCKKRRVIDDLPLNICQDYVLNSCLGNCDKIHIEKWFPKIGDDYYINNNFNKDNNIKIRYITPEYKEAIEKECERIRKRRPRRNKNHKRGSRGRRNNNVYNSSSEDHEIIPIDEYEDRDKMSELISENIIDIPSDDDICLPSTQLPLYEDLYFSPPPPPPPPPPLIIVNPQLTEIPCNDMCLLWNFNTHFLISKCVNINTKKEIYPEPTSYDGNILECPYFT